MESLAADLPESLLEADEMLARYGRWAVSGARRLRRCGSAEGQYRAPGTMALEARRTPRVALPEEDRVAAQRALARVPERERQVLIFLYVPARVPPWRALRQAGVPPRLSRERHLVGLRIWWNLFQALRRRA